MQNYAKGTATIIVAILQQKVGANAKGSKQYAEFRKKRDEDEQSGTQEVTTMLVRRARIAKGATVRWKRVCMEYRKQEAEDEASQDPDKEDQPYDSRLLAC